MAKNHGFPKGYEPHIVDAVVQHVPAGTRLALDANQAAIRRAVPVEDEPGVYELKKPSQFKRGEIIGLDSEAPKGTALVPLNKAAEIPQKPVKGPKRSSNADQEPETPQEKPKGITAAEGKELALLSKLSEPTEQEAGRIAELREKLTGRTRE